MWLPTTKGSQSNSQEWLVLAPDSLIARYILQQQYANKRQSGCCVLHLHQLSTICYHDSNQCN